MDHIHRIRIIWAYVRRCNADIADWVRLHSTYTRRMNSNYSHSPFREQLCWNFMNLLNRIRRLTHHDRHRLIAGLDYEYPRIHWHSWQVLNAFWILWSFSDINPTWVQRSSDADAGAPENHDFFAAGRATNCSTSELNLSQHRNEIENLGLSRWSCHRTQKLSSSPDIARLSLSKKIERHRFPFNTISMFRPINFLRISSWDTWTFVRWSACSFAFLLDSHFYSLWSDIARWSPTIDRAETVLWNCF
jgi:hypothetical protein